MQDISKHYDLTLETKSNKLNKEKLIYNFGDNITLNIKITEDGKPKNITNCKIDLIAQNQKEDSQPIKHSYEDGGIEIVDGELGLIQIRCKNNYIDRVGANTGQLFISDEDENVSTQKFLFITSSTLMEKTLEDAEDKIDTLRKLDASIDEYISKLEETSLTSTTLEEKVKNNDLEIRKQLSNTETYLTEKVKEIEDNINESIEGIGQQVSDLEKDIRDKIDGVTDMVDYQLVKIQSLTPISITGSTTIGFSSDSMSIPAKELVRSGYMVHVSGSPSSTTIVQSAIGSLVFYQEVSGGNQIIRCKMFVFQDISIQGRQLTPSVWFINSNGDIVDNITDVEVDYKILIKANISRSNIETGQCYMTPLGKGIIK